MKIGFYLGELFPSDGGVYTLETALLESILNYATEHELFIFTARNEDKRTSSKHKLIELPKDSAPSLRYKICSKFGFLNKKSTRQTALTKLANDHKIDLIWFFNGHIQTEVPYVMSVQDLQHRKQPIFPEVNTYGWKWDQREELYASPVRRAVYTISGSEEGKKDIEFYYQIPSDRIHVIKLPTPNDALVAKQNEISLPSEINIQTPYIFYPAQFWSHKNHITLLLALKKLDAESPGKLKLVLTGSDKGNLTYIREKISEFNLSKIVDYLGVVDRSTLLALYKNAEALVFPTLFGPDNLPPLEAFALGCPVIAGDLPGCDKYFNKAAYLVSPTDENQLADAIRKVLTDSTLRQSLVTAGLARAKEQTSETYLKQIFEIIDQYAKFKRCWGKMI